MGAKTQLTSLGLRFKVAIQDHAVKVDVALLFLVATYGLICRKFPVVDFWSLLVTEKAAYTGLTDTLTTSAALVTGFAGVVVVFALEADSPRFRTLRLRGGKQLRSSWTSVSGSGFLSLAIGFLTHMVFAGPLAPLGVWTLTYGVLVLTHSSWRLLWLLRKLAGAVNAEDIDREISTKIQKTSDLPFPKDRRGELGRNVGN